MIRSRKLLLFLILFLTVALVFSVELAMRSQEIREKAAGPANSPSETNRELLTAHEGYLNATGANRAQALARLRQVARGRKEKLREKLRKDPAQFLQEVLPEDVLAKLPQELRNEGLVETKRKVTGTLEVIHFDDFEKKSSRLEHHLVTHDQEKQADVAYRLYFGQTTQQPLTSSMEVTVSGYSLDQELVAPTNQVSANFQILAAPSPIPTGTQAYAVIMFNFLNDRSQPMSAPDIRARLLADIDSSRAFYEETSFGQATVAADIFGYYTIPFEKNVIGCDSLNWAIAADAIAFDNGVPIQDYSRRMYIFPNPNNCHGGAWATVSGNPSRAWMPGQNSQAFTFTHEIGHNLGMAHANTLICGPTPIGKFENYLYDCRSFEYGDPYEVMGYYYHQLNSPHKRAVGFLPDQAQTITTSGTYTLSSLSTAGPGVKALIIPVPNANTGAYYYLGYRQAVPYFDSQLPAGVTRGVQLHLDYGYENSPTFLLDTTPEATNSAGYNDLSNSSLSDNASFIDPENGITVTQISHNSSSATVQVTLDESVCRRKPLAVRVDPASQTGGLGQTLTYTLTLRNDDNSLCGSDSVNLSGYYREGWEIEFVPPGPYVFGPGQSTSIQVKITPVRWNTTPIGTHTITVYGYGDFQRHAFDLSLDYVLSGVLNRVEIEPRSVSTAVGQPIGLSALAYDNNSRPIWNGITYEWGMSSQGSIATLQPNYNIATLVPLRPGSGQLYVVARFGDGSITGSIPVTVTGVAASPTISPSGSVIPPPVFSITDLKQAMSLYLDKLDEAYWVDGKINVLDAGYIMRYLVQ